MFDPQDSCFPEPLFGFVTNITLNENPEGDQCTLGVDCLSNSTINIVEDGTVNEERETDESIMNETFRCHVKLLLQFYCAFQKEIQSIDLLKCMFSGLENIF